MEERKADIDEFKLIALKDWMSYLAGIFYKKYKRDPVATIEWNEFFVNNFFSVYISCKEGLSLLFPFDLIRFSIFDEFTAEFVKEIHFFIKFHDKLPTLAQFIPIMRNVANNCSYHLTTSEYRLLVAAMNSEFNGNIKNDLIALKKSTRSTRGKRQLLQRLTELGVYNTGIRINYPVIGLVPVLVYHDKYVELPASLIKYVYLQIDSNKRMISSLLFIPEVYSDRILPKLKRLGRTSKLIKGGSCYNLSSLDLDNNRWKIDLKEILVNLEDDQSPKELDFIAFEDATRIEQINDQFIDIVSHISSVEALRAKELATITGKSPSSVNKWFSKIMDSKVCKLQIVLKYIGLQYIYHVLVEKDGSSSLIAALHYFPKISIYEFKEYYLFLAYVPKETVLDLDDFFDRHGNKKPFKVLSRGLVELGVSLRFQNLDLRKLWDKKNKNWSYKE
ncbi:MAG: hypothetical protein ACTSRU_10430 [Candidatus Hodarchaeales archaeon]